MDILLLIVRLFLSAVFTVAGAAKLMDPAGTRKSVGDFGASTRLVPALSGALPMLELGTGAALIPVPTAWWGAASALGLLLLFLAAIAVNLAQGKKPACHCFGQLHSTPLGWWTLGRNGLFAAGALCVVVRGPHQVGAGVGALAGKPGASSAMMAVSAMLAMASALEFWMLLHVLGQHGRMLARVDALEANAGVPSTHTEGLPVGAPLPAFALRNLEGEPVTIDSLQDENNTAVLFFFEPGCPGCEELLPDVGAWQTQYTGRMAIVPISGGETGAIRQRGVEHGLRNVLVQNREEVSEALLVYSTPSAVAIRDGKIASPVAMGGEAIRQLIHRQSLPSARKGDRAPSVQLPGMDGRMVDLSQAVQGRRTLLLFWSPFCGYCREMLGDLLAWEKQRPTRAPELVIVSTGSAAHNQSQGLSSPILLDPHYSASHVFGVEGTPSAVLLDEEGVVVSDVLSGRNAVLELVGATG